MEILANIPVNITLKKVLTRLHISETDSDAKSVAGLFDWAKEVLNPKALYDVCYIDVNHDDKVVLNGITFTSRVLSVNLQKAHRVFPYITTCGIELETPPSDFQDFMVPFWLDAVKELALGEAYSYLRKYLIRQYRPGKLSHMAPGSLEDWPISQQKELFRLFGDVDEKIGVTLSDSFLMFPIKSISGIFFPTETNFESCQLCSREDCPGRRAAYDEHLWEEYHKHQP